MSSLIYKLCIGDEKTNSSDFVYAEVGHKLKMSYGFKNIEDVHSGDLLFDGKKINQISTNEQPSVQKEIENNSNIVILKKTFDKDDMIDFIKNNKKIPNDIKEKLFDYIKDVEKTYYIKDESLLNSAKLLSNLFKVDVGSKLRVFLKDNKDNQEYFTDYIYNIINDKSLSLWDKLQKIDEKTTMSYKDLSNQNDDEILIAYKILSNVFNAYCEVYDIKSIDNKEQLLYISNNIQDMFLNGTKVFTLTKDHFKEMFELYNDEILYNREI